MTEHSDERAWAEHEFGLAELGHLGRLKRLIAVAERVATAPRGKITEVFTDGASREGAFRFVQNDFVDEEEVMRAAHLSCAQRSCEYPFVYVPVDQTSINLTDESGEKGLGDVGRSCDHARGLQVMTGIAISPDGTPLGLSGQCYWARKVGPKKTPEQRAKQLASEKETQRWLDVIAQTREAFSMFAPTTRPWFQLDAGADAWPILVESVASSGWLTVRACRDRRLETPSEESQHYLWATMEREEPLGDYLLAVPASKKRKARTARMTIRARPVTLDLKDRRTGERFSLDLWAVLAREEGTAPRGEEPLEWLLLTTYPVSALESAHAVVMGYAQRWRVEDFHKAWKSGACHVEDNQLRDQQHIVIWAAILASVAMRIVRLTWLSRTAPELPATVEFTQPEIDAIILASRTTKYEPGDVPTIAEAVLWIAAEGGYTGKSSGGPPGVLVLARGLKSLRVLARVLADRKLTEKRRSPTREKK